MQIISSRHCDMAIGEIYRLMILAIEVQSNLLSQEPNEIASQWWTI
jgi:hypothetical protein